MSSKVTFDDQYLNHPNASGDSTPKLSASPIDIPNSRDSSGERRRASRRRRRDSSVSSSSQSGDSPATPPGNGSPSDGSTSPIDVATSPILSYFLSHASPIKQTNRFSFKQRRKSVGSPSAVFEDVDEDEDVELPHVLHHARRVSHSWHNTGTIGIPQKGPITGSQQERNNSLMRRLSIGTAFANPRPTPESNFNPLTRVTSSPSPAPQSFNFPPVEVRAPTPRATQRSATISVGSKVHRPPSPMGERMLKGDFHGF